MAITAGKIIVLNQAAKTAESEAAEPVAVTTKMNKQVDKAERVSGYLQDVCNMDTSNPFDKYFK